MNTLTSPKTLSIPELEQVYDILAQAIDKAGPELSEKFLVKLALLNANAQADPSHFSRQIDMALRDL